MTIFDDKHPRGRADNAGQFRDKCNSEPEAGIVIPVYESNGLTVPADWNGDYRLHPATDWMGDRMQGGEIVAHPDPINARCDYAEVDENGIAYGYELPPSLLGEIVAGPQGDDESDSDYAERVYADDGPERDQAITEFFRERYGADLIDSGDYGNLDLEFFVPYGVEGAAGTSVESMGDRAENETKLLDARNDFEASGSMQAALAAKLGYQIERTFTKHGDFDTAWVKIVPD